ncbi:TonB-linked outer membrane protein, SusC/RagA family [Reichenbachiella agariperforans]|uniref:TonB-linked outer membrane protein, SusC/RagA family n=2 Tax=Reichenbachiella agariperforans TaxID=156994 RepID=A0A1M6KEN9_REIAG|nr:TonB-linked outer membrane protein, SusC/RagA family [Reichenbachiella agariperforans]
MKAKLLVIPLRCRAIFIGLYLLCGLMSSANAWDGKAIKSIEDIYVTIQMEEGNLEETFTTISEQTGLNFHYDRQLAVSRSVKSEMSQVTLGECLRYLAKEAQLNFRRINETIHVEDAAGTKAQVTESFYEQDLVVTGTVRSEDDGTGLPGVNVVIKGSTVGTVTDIDGNFRINVPSKESVLYFSFIGYIAQEALVGDQAVIDVVMKLDVTSLEEVVIVGYGEQKKETVVGAVSQTDAAVLERVAGVPNVSTALTGNLPGVITTASTGMPGDENPQIVIRGVSSWNGSQPLILVDGVERPEYFNTMDVGSVENISVLKDASATAVFGSRGANGVVIVTTKRGREGKAEITARVNTTAKIVSKLPGTLDSYSAIRVRNQAIENELSNNPGSWDFMIPQSTVDKYRYPADAAEAERYPNVDWQNELFKDYAMAYNANIGIRGGTEITKYFASIDYQNEGDLMKDANNNRGYDPGYSYNRLNFRSNLDFQLTPTTKLSTNLSGTYGVRKTPWGGGNEYPFWIAAYGNAPDAFIPRYSDGTWGFYEPNVQGGLNSVRILALSGVQYTTRAQMSTNFSLEQDLDFVLKGLKFTGTLAVDNQFVEIDRGVNDQYNAVQEKWINPQTGQTLYGQNFDAATRFDFYDQGASWSPTGGSVADWESQRRLYYQLRLNYDKTIAEKHNVGLMGLMSRQEDVLGSQIPRYREDWVFRATYNYDGKYSIEYNGAYNGSEKFGVDYRFAFFSSGGVNWMLSEENFMKGIPFLDVLKLRASYGEVGDDQVAGRFLFADTWNYQYESQLGTAGVTGEYSPYTWYRQTELGNPSVRWETVYKYNAGVDFGFFKGLISGSVDVFRDRREDILIGDGRAVPFYFGASPPVANLGEMQTQGYEVVLNIEKNITNSLRVWASMNMTHAKDEIINRDDPELLPEYQKQAGYQLGQARTHISADYYDTWDELYASTPHDNNDQAKIPGNRNILDYNADGIITAQDAAPFGFSGTPQNTYSTTVGFEWKGLSAFVQFYGVTNVTRQVVFTSLSGQLNRVYEEGSYWSEDNTNADQPMPRWLSTPNYNTGSRYMYDGSYLRLKNAEIAYRFSTDWINKIGLSSMRVYVNGNNLLLWTKMPDDRESNFAGNGWAAQGAYPTVKRVNLGLNLTF